MNTSPDIEQIAADLVAGKLGEDSFSELDSPATDELVEHLLKSPDSRRWLRNSSLLTGDLAMRLLEHIDDFHQSRFDASLAKVVNVVPLDALVSHTDAIAAGSGAPAMWIRLAEDRRAFASACDAVLASGRSEAINATATHLLLDRSDSYGLRTEDRSAIALSILETDADIARAVAAEFLAAEAPGDIGARLDQLARDRSASVRGFAWIAAFRQDRELAAEQAVALLGDETAGVEVRRSALNAAGEQLPTEQMIGLLSYFVAHPNRDLALDAAQLLYQQHRHPEIAITAAGSPHVEVREIAQRLMDPYRGSPAAGGSRPGDPTREDPLLKLMRQLEEEESG